MDPARLHQLTDRLSALLRGSVREVATAHELKLVQLESLIYLTTANRYSDTPNALTEYLGVTKGTVSQTLKALERRGLITKAQDAEDGRVLHCSVSDAGRAIVAEAYPSALFDRLSRAQHDEVVPMLQSLLSRLQRANGLRTFGVCNSCRFFETRARSGRGGRGGRGGRCGLTGEALSADDTKKICREHSPPDPRSPVYIPDP